jgi:hypothetical protein
MRISKSLIVPHIPSPIRLRIFCRYRSSSSFIDAAAIEKPLVQRPHRIALCSNEFKLKSGIKQVSLLANPFESVLCLRSLPPRAEEVTGFCF